MKVRNRLLGAAVIAACTLTVGCTLTGYAQQKPVPTGLVTMGLLGFNSNPSQVPDVSFKEAFVTHPNRYTGVVLAVTWKQLEVNGPAVIDQTIINDALARIATYNQTHSPQIKAILRVFSSANAPNWVLNYTGVGTVQLHDPSGQAIYTYPRAWDSAYHTLWHQMQNKLANLYDGNPLISEVAITSCALIDDEPFKTATNQTDINAEHAAGFTDAQEHTCLLNAATVDYAGWKTTPLEFDIGNTLDSDGVTKIPYYTANTDYSLQMMAAFRNAFSTRAIISNHGYDNPIHPNALPLYTGQDGCTGFDGWGSPVSFQSDGTNPDVTQTDGGWGAMMYNAMNNEHATEFELFQSKAGGGLAKYSDNQLICWGKSFAGTQPITTSCPY